MKLVAKILLVNVKKGGMVVATCLDEARDSDTLAQPFEVIMRDAEISPFGGVDKLTDKVVEIGVNKIEIYNGTLQFRANIRAVKKA